MVNYHLLISGRVQGVGFRWGAKQLADRFHLTGFVQNLVTGQVYLEVQGDQVTVADFIKLLKKGPTPYCRITTIKQRRGEVTDYPAEFAIKI